MIFLKYLLIICSYLIVIDFTDILAKGLMFAMLNVCYSSDKEGGALNKFKRVSMQQNIIKRLRFKMIIKVTDIISELYINKEQES